MERGMSEKRISQRKRYVREKECWGKGMSGEKESRYLQPVFPLKYSNLISTIPSLVQ
ncbi:411_t:CDS:2 [Dentiscutata erythropus]|uniref:411_t:CDS:1 n=1 Tax=Dentiscutata erythropus TaxID=1348616 RepID=A0A9N9AIF7_9GLOM|nr:411_t:CDS:2 [Dentiscutata erythropus]